MREMGGMKGERERERERESMTLLVTVVTYSSF